MNRKACVGGAADDQTARLRLIVGLTTLANRATLVNCTCADAVMINPWFDADKPTAMCKGLDAKT